MTESLQAEHPLDEVFKSGEFGALRLVGDRLDGVLLRHVQQGLAGDGWLCLPGDQVRIPKAYLFELLRMDLDQGVRRVLLDLTGFACLDVGFDLRVMFREREELLNDLAKLVHEYQGLTLIGYLDDTPVVGTFDNLARKCDAVFDLVAELGWVHRKSAQAQGYLTESRPWGERLQVGKWVRLVFKPEEMKEVGV